jgi:glycosyltransferase involved in cell wall biosynthesis
MFISEKTVQRWVKSGEIPHKKTPSGRTVFLKTEIDNYLAKLYINRNVNDDDFFQDKVQNEHGLIKHFVNTTNIDEKIVNQIIDFSFTICGIEMIKQLTFSNEVKEKINIKLNDMHIQKNNKIENLSLVHDKKYHIGESKDLIYFLDDVRNLSSITTYELNVKNNVIILKMYSAQNLISDYGIQFKQDNFEQVYLTKTIRNMYWDCFKTILLENENYQKSRTNWINIETQDFENPLNLLNDFLLFLQHIIKSDSPGILLSKYWVKVWHERTDLQNTFRQPHSRDQQKFLEWISEYSEKENLIPSEDFFPREIKCKHHEFNKDNKIVYIGYLNSVTGLGEAARNNVAMLKRQKKKFSKISYNRINGESYFRDCNCTMPFSGKFINKLVFIHINPDNMDTFFQDFYWLNKYNNHLIFIWAWEMENPSEKMKYWAPFSSEIWGVSSFVAKSIQKIDGKLRIKVFHHFFNKSNNKLNLSSRDSYVLAACDYNSWSKRKNIDNTIEAFLSSQLPCHGITLKIKTLNLSKYPLEKAKLSNYTKKHKFIEVIDGKMDEKELDNLYEKALIYISLHRSEGFGLNILKAMSKGTPVIVTKYSGNLDFCESNNSKLVDFELIDLDSESAKIFGHNKWASANIEQASEFLNDLYFDKLQWEKYSINAFETFNELFSHEKGYLILNSLIIKSSNLLNFNRIVSIITKIIFAPLIHMFRYPHKIKLFLSKLTQSNEATNC